MTSADDHELFRFIDEDNAFEGDAHARSRATDGHWKILIVDDEPEVHAATLLALRGLMVEGRPLDFFHAHSAREAEQVLTTEPDLAVMLLDVVMESDDAGLELVRRTRKTLGRTDIRIILRTGQPGYAPEVDTIRDYDINDYKNKAELTRTRLFISLTVAIRSYRQIRQSETTRRGLETIIAASLDLGREHGVRRFADGVVTQLCALLGVSQAEGLVCAAAPCADEAPRVVAAAGRFSSYIGQPIDALPDPAVVESLKRTLHEHPPVSEHSTCLFFPVQGTSGMAAYVAMPNTLSDVDRKLIEVFSANITAGFENAYLQQRIADLAYRDSLLDLPNRNALIEWIDQAAPTESMAEAPVLAQVDIDHFSDINTILDQSFGDQVLRAVAQRLLERFEPLARVARVGVDVFGIYGRPTHVHEAAIAAVFDEPFKVGEHLLRLSATSGFVACQGDSRTGQAALRNSAIATKQAKSQARSKSAVFDPTQSQSARERMLRLSALREDFAQQRLFLVFQPCTELSSRRVVGAEALLRWRTASGEFIPPDRFIPLAEESGLMVPIGEWILRTALREQRQFRTTTGQPFRMAVNVSHVQFREPGFVPMLRKVIADSGVDPSDIELELTESVAIDDIEHIVHTLQQVRALGVTVAIDDFGTGYSSLSVLRRLPVNRLKIDRSFVNDVEQDDSIARLVVGLAQQLGLDTIAEGVETEAQHQLLLQLGCHEGQGYLYDRPMPASELLARLGATA